MDGQAACEQVLSEHIEGEPFPRILHVAPSREEAESFLKRHFPAAAAFARTEDHCGHLTFSGEQPHSGAKIWYYVVKVCGA